MQPTYTVLVVDDDPLIRKTLNRHLKKSGFKVVEAEDGKKALEKVEETSPNLILLDIMMPEMNGFEVCKKLRDDFKSNSIYIIMLSAKGKTEEKVQGLSFGADDYVTKPFDPKELIARIQTGIRTMKDKVMATNDELTGLGNRYFINNILQQEIERAQRYQKSLSVFIMDLDHFKKVNDTYGHDVGDEVLAEAARILKESCRNIDIPGRWGGEEFIALLPETDTEGAVVVAERTRSKMESFDFPKVGRQTASFGIATLKTDEADLFKRADQALYQAKEAGRNKVVSSE